MIAKADLGVAANAGHRKWALPASVGLIGLVTLLALAPYWRSGPANDVDTIMGVFRVYELDQAWRAGVLFPRLAPDFNFTYGAPLFHFYPPLISYVILAFHWLGLGWIGATNAACGLTVFLAGLGAYLYARALFADERAALVGGLAFLAAPYLLVAIVDRGALAEAISLALIPWAFWACHHLLVDRATPWLPIAAATVALMMLGHNITALFMVPVIALYFGVLALRSGSARRLPWLAAALALGLALSAFYWLPALAERRFTHVESNLLQGHYQVQSHLAPLADALQASPVFQYWGTPNRRLSLWQLVLAGVALFALPWQPRPLRRPLVMLGLGVLVSLLLQMPRSAAFWSAVPLVAFIEFPWRLFGFVAFFAALLAASLLRLDTFRRGRRGWIVLAVVLVAILAGSLPGLPRPVSPDAHRTTDAQIDVTHMFDLGRSFYPLFHDFLSASVPVNTEDLATPRTDWTGALPPLASPPSLQVTEERYDRIVLRVHAPAAFTLRLHRAFFPGWQVYAGGSPVPTQAGGAFGVVTASLPAGDYTAIAQFGATPVRQVAFLLTAAAVLLCAAWLLIKGGRRRRTLVWSLAAVIAIVFGLAHVDPSQAPRRPMARAATFGDQIQLLGYDLPRGAWQSGDTVTVRLYWLATRVPAQNYRVFLHLAQLDDSGKVAQVDSEPIYGFAPTTRWDPGEVVPDEYRLSLDGVPAGHYRLLVGIYQVDPLQNLTVSGATDVLSGDRVALSPVDVHGSS